MTEVFVSYASADRARVEPLVQALEATGLPLWWDRDIDYGQSFRTKIEQALAAAPCVIVAWTRDSIQSEWVVNEASDARKRSRLVPVLLDPVTPPLEFRHLHTIDLSDWHGDASDPRLTDLRKSVMVMVGQSDGVPPLGQPAAPVRAWWHTWPARLLGAGVFLIGTSLLLWTLGRMGLVGSSNDPVDGATGTPVQSSVATSQTTGDESKHERDRTSQAPPARSSERQDAAPPPDTVNLLDTDAGAQLLVTNRYQEDYWKRLFTSSPEVAPGIFLNGFAVLSLRGETPPTFDTLAVLVEQAYAPMGVKELGLYASSGTADGPFAKVIQIAVPNHYTPHKPFHEFHFPPVQARFVKLIVMSTHASGTRAYVGTIQLYDSRQ